MSLHRRSFIQRSLTLSLGGLLSAAPAWSRNLQRAISDAANIPPADLASEEDFWNYIRQSFTVSSSIINLNNGGVSPAPKSVQDAMKRYYDLSNEAPSYYMWRVLDQGRENLRQNLASVAGCDAEEIAINRNASEGLETIIFGLQLQKGDEVVASLQDYPNVINAWKLRELRDGIVVKWINLELPSENEDYLVRQFTNAFSSKTKVVNITHIINWNGQVLPVKKIAAEAHKRGIEVLVDGAHSFAHIDFSIPDLDADYFATSLHKWLFAPIGSGMLYVRKNKISNIYPLFASGDPLKNDIRKFEHLGTRPFYIEQAIQKAIDFHHLLGIERKQKRLHYLKNYWMERVMDVPGVVLGTSPNPEWACALGIVGVKGKDASLLDQYLFNNYKIHTTTVNWENISGVRVTPNVYTSTRELDKLVTGIRKFAAL